MLELTDYLEILKRRKWLVLICLVVGLLGAGILFILLPKVYRSSTLVLIESQKVPTDYIKPVVVDTIEERLITIQQQILSRTLLQKIIEEFGLYKDELKRSPLEEVIEQMRKDIKVTTVDDSMHRNIQAFTVSYDGDNPLTVMQVTNKLASLFIEENLKVREQLVEGTSEFLEHELKSLKEKLDREEAEISAYKRKHMGTLPQQAEGIMRQLDRMHIELQSESDTLRMLVEKREILRDTASAPSGSGARRDIALSPRARLRQLRYELAQLRAEYKETYPDIMRIKREIKDLEDLIAKRGSKASLDELEEELTSSAEGDTELRAVEAELKVRKQRRGELEEQIKTVERRLEVIPMREQELASLVRDYENSKLRYQTLLTNKEQAKVSQNLERRQKGEQFRILDPANLPMKPVKPDPLKVFIGGIFAGLMLGAGAVWWVDFRNLPFRRGEEVESAVGIPVFATIPHMFMAWDAERQEESSKEESAESRRARCARWWKRWVVRPLRRANPTALYTALPRQLKSGSTDNPQGVFRAHMNALGAEQFRVLAGRIVQVREKKGIKIFAITSSLAGEGKTTIALGLAVTLARDYLEDAILIDGDIRNPEVSTRLGLQDEKGLIDVLSGHSELEGALYRHSQPNLRILPAGTSTTAQVPRGLTASRLGMQELLLRLKERDVFVILDAPPILPMADMNLYSEVVDTILLVVRAEQTPQKFVAEALRFLSGGSIEGIILNDVLTPRHQYYGRYAYAEPPPVL